MIKAFTYKRALICLLQLFAGAYAYAQETAMKHYTGKDGLPSGTIYSMLNDSKGYLWFATDAGVSRFDGHRFINFTLSNGLSDNEVMKIAEDSKGKIWFLGLSGTLSYYYNGKFFNPSNDSILGKAKINNTYIFFFEDKEHRLWFSSYTGYTVIDKDKVEIMYATKDHVQSEGIVMNRSLGGVVVTCPEALDDKIDAAFVYKDKKATRYIVPYHKEIRSRFCRLPDGSVLFVAREGIVWQKDTTQQLILPRIQELTGLKILGLMLSSDNLLWIETEEKGIFCYNYNDMKAAPVRYLENTGIADATEDMEHNIWLSTFGDGVYMLPAGYKAVNNYYCGNYNKHNVYCVTKDDQGTIYTGHDDATVNMLKNGIAKNLLLKHRKNGGFLVRISKLLIHQGDLWIGSDADLLHVVLHNNYNTVTEIRQPRLPGSVFKDPFVRIASVKDIAWFNNGIIACSGYMILIRDTNKFSYEVLKPIPPPYNRKYCVQADKKGIVWYGAHDGLYSYNGRNEINHASESIYLSSRINDIGETDDSVLVLASYGYGILFYKDGKILHHLTEDNGLCNNICKRISIHDNKIYVATANGAARFTYDHGHIDSVKKFTMADGLLSDNVNDIYADDSMIYFATSEGLTVLNTGVPGNKTVAPPVYITGINCKGRQLLPGSSYTLSYDQNSIQFTYTGISYKAPGDVLYQYRLTDDQKWMETKNTSIDIPYLASGKYHFQLRARILDGQWSGIRSFYFAIDPPFWKTYWFITFCGLLLIIIVIIITRYRLGIIKRKESEQLKIKDQVAYLEQQALQAMMNPHFIFNVMNSIQHYINNNEKHEANIYLADFARLIRMNLDISSKRYIPLDDEVAYLELYLALESLRFGKGLTYNINVDAVIDGDETMVPVMLLQPFIENAIWHGILPKKEEGHVQVDIKKEKDGMLKITITDNGIGIPFSIGATFPGLKTHVSHGMKMTQQRLDLIGRITGHTLYIHIQDAYPGAEYKGTTVEFLLPGDLS